MVTSAAGMAGLAGDGLAMMMTDDDGWRGVRNRFHQLNTGAAQLPSTSSA
jgi:hypothetical protein